MALLTKSDLRHSYSWTTYATDNPKITGEPDSTLLNRNEGYEVLYMINSFAKKHALANKQSGLKTEKMIKEHLPGDIRQQSKVAKWLADNWKEY
ncbi:MAG: hypothetical protein ACP59X_08415 [Solidesulfovibrio sp. DCME]|uniref:hypothetical protein n=1 Tax=Solidesulfovibrio sp. DCME TaxID=3447380 RepID=UPI003D0DF45D